MYYITYYYILPLTQDTPSFTLEIWCINVEKNYKVIQLCDWVLRKRVFSQSGFSILVM